jgi:hypothetical protein
MSLHNFGNDNSVLTINGRIISDFGENASPYTDSPIDPKTVLRRGQGGRAVRLNRKNPGRAVSIYLNPGSQDSAYMQGLFNSNANITASWTQVGTLEAAVGTEGVIVNDAAMNRAGTTISDDQYDLQFNVWNASKGGE